MTNGDFTQLVTVTSIGEPVSDELKELMLEHITNLQNEFRRYFQDEMSPLTRMVRDPFTAEVTS